MSNDNSLRDSRNFSSNESLASICTIDSCSRSYDSLNENSPIPTKKPSKQFNNFISIDKKSRRERDSRMINKSPQIADVLHLLKQVKISPTINLKKNLFSEEK